LEEKARIIIKKVKKRGHGDAHGGSWKVAYADFVTAMMAFFLLMWLLAMVAPEKRAGIADYFNNYSVFQSQSQSSGSSLLGKSAGVLDFERIRPPAPREASREGKEGEEAFAKRMRSSIDEKLHAIKQQVLVDTTSEGVRIQIVDNEGSEIFRLGSAELTERARSILRLVCENMQDKDNRIVVEGHTDSAPFKSGQKTNWELSTSRASAARRDLENNGIDPGRIARVVGFADQDPLIRENPQDLRNRRISIILLQ
jgi:chemotaxis protein MotB